VYNGHHEVDMLKAGEKAPDFELPDADMEIVHLADFMNTRNVVLYFYVRDDTPGCTAQAIEFSDLESEFAALGWVVLGVSKDDCISHGVFRDKHGITVRLLADKDCTACRAYGVLVKKEVDGVVREGVQRSTFVIDRQGMIRHALYGVPAKGHAEEILDLIKEL
jgi:peroxiredoxin Q/BCP